MASLLSKLLLQLFVFISSTLLCYRDSDPKRSDARVVWHRTIVWVGGGLVKYWLFKSKTQVKIYILPLPLPLPLFLSPPSPLFLSPPALSCVQVSLWLHLLHIPTSGTGTCSICPHSTSGWTLQQKTTCWSTQAHYSGHVEANNLVEKIRACNFSNRSRHL